MKKLLKIISFLGLGFTFLPSVFVLKGWISLENHFSLMIIGMILWFSTSPFWMKSKSLDEVEN